MGYIHCDEDHVGCPETCHLLPSLGLPEAVTWSHFSVNFSREGELKDRDSIDCGSFVLTLAGTT